jgi:hypothetical protein
MMIKKLPVYLLTLAAATVLLSGQQTYVSPVGESISTMGTGTGITACNDTGAGFISCTIARTQFIANAVTADFTVTTLPVNTRVEHADLKITTAFACSATSTSSTLSLQLGKGAGGTEYLASIDADAATGWFGDADAEMGTLLTRAAAINGGTFSATAQAVVLRITSGTGAVGTGAATNLSTGLVTVFLKVQPMQ